MIWMRQWPSLGDSIIRSPCRARWHRRAMAVLTNNPGSLSWQGHTGLHTMIDQTVCTNFKRHNDVLNYGKYAHNLQGNIVDGFDPLIYSVYLERCIVYRFVYRYTVFNTLRQTCSICNYNDVIMGAIASQITSLTIVYSIVYSDADQRKYQSSASLAFVRVIHRGPVNSPHKCPVTRKCFRIMTSSWYAIH